MFIHPTITCTLFGTFLKLIDDIYDNPIIGKYFSPTGIEFIKAFIFVLLSHISAYDFNTLFILFVSHLVIPLFDKDCINNSYFMAGMVILAILCITSFPVNFNLGVIVLMFISLILYSIFDNKYIKEESSQTKILFRSASVLGLLTLFAIRFFFLDLFKIDNTIVVSFDMTIAASLGYFVTSVINMTITELH